MSNFHFEVKSFVLQVGRILGQVLFGDVLVSVFHAWDQVNVGLADDLVVGGYEWDISWIIEEIG